MENVVIKQITSRGNQEKYYDYNSKTLYKIDKHGYQSIAEVLVSTLEMFIKDIDFVDYSLVKYKDGYACACRSYLKEGEMDISFQKLLGKYYSNYEIAKYFNRFSVDSLEFLVEGIHKASGLDIRDYLATMIYLDAIVLNEDRHYDNMVLIYDGKNYRPSPYFDFGGSLLSNTIYYPVGLSADVGMSLAKAKPFSQSFEEQTKLFNREPLLIDIKGFMSYLNVIESNLDMSVPFKQEEYFRAKEVLIKSLKKWEGILWKKLY